MTMEELKEASQRHYPVMFNGAEYICIGVQVLYLGNERLVSACLQDKRNCLLWANVKKVKKIEN